MFLSSRDWEVGDQDTERFSSFKLHTTERWGGVSLAFIRSLILFIRALPPRPNYFPGIQTPNRASLEVKVSIYKFGSSSCSTKIPTAAAPVNLNCYLAQPLKLSERTNLI